MQAAIGRAASRPRSSSEPTPPEAITGVFSRRASAPVAPGAEPPGDRRLVADPPAELAGDCYPGEDRPDRLDVDRLTGPGAVQIDQVDEVSPFRLPARRHRGRVVAEDRLLPVIPLPE